MAFIDKNEPVVLNIKLTDKGREQLSKGKLNFTKYSISDSEINYQFISDNSINIDKLNILRPVDNNPQQLSFITQDLTGNTLNNITNIQSVPTIVQNTATEYGFFSISGNTVSILTDPIHIKQESISIHLNQVTGGTLLHLYKSSTYGTSLLEPSINDYMMIRWTNPNGASTDNYIINQNIPQPCLFYKIQNIISGSLASNNLIVQVDRLLPDFSNQGSGNAGGFIYYNNYFASGNTPYYTTDFMGDSIFSFFENTANPVVPNPFFNMSLVFTEELSGILSTYKKFSTFNTAGYGGFVSYIQNQNPVNKILGIIHYSNISPSNTYGEELYLNTPVLNLPTIMWHKATDNKMGLVLSCYGNQKLLTGETVSLNTTYYDLADSNGNIVGKVFTDLKLFVIEDQELIFAMSYKSNRSWTLPKPFVGFNAVVSSCPQCVVQATVSKTDITTGTGSITVSNVVSGGPAPIFLDIKLSGTTIYFNIFTGTTFTLSGLTVGNYTITIYDTNSANCYITYNKEILNIYAATWNALNSGTSTLLSSTYFIDDNNGWVAGQIGLIRKTINGGNTWITQTTGINSDILSIFFINSNNGWACTSNGTILHTTNGGTNWIVQNSTVSVYLSYIYFINLNEGWCCGDNGVILHTTNGGTNWSLQTSNITKNLLNLSFVDNNNGWCCGLNGTILHTTNGGTSWSLQTSNTTNTLDSIYMLTNIKGWVCGFGGTVLKYS